MPTESSEKYTLLLVDDDSFLMDMYSLKFTQAGHEVHAVMSVKDALTKLREGLVPDAIVTDLVMPDMDGFAFLQTVTEENLAPNAARIVLSNQGEKEDIDRVNALGAAGHIVKANAIPSEVVSGVERMVREHKASS